MIKLSQIAGWLKKERVACGVGEKKERQTERQSSSKRLANDDSRLLPELLVELVFVCKAGGGNDSSSHG